MKIGIIGYGKMGKTIEGLALAKGHEVILKIDKNNTDQMTIANLKELDVAIEFTRPDSAADNLKKCIEAGTPVICGTTAWLDRLEEVKTYNEEQKGAFMYASNFSIGVNIFFELNRHLTRMMSNYAEYNPTMEEIHHTQKLDAPSGTGISLAEDLMKIHPKKEKWVNTETDVSTELALTSKRIDNVPGTHTVDYSSEVDTIEIKHTAHSREGFAKGALSAAEWIVGRKGCFTMRDMLGF
jgi:4-hydroxy-tetrahydrodipicolinate reductase